MLAAACKDSTGPRSISATLTVCSLPAAGESKVCPATTVLPNRALEVTVLVVPTGDIAVDQVVITASGILTLADTFVAVPPIRVTGSAVDTLAVPIAFGAITIRAIARGGGLSDTTAPVSVAVADAEPPVVQAVAVSPTDSVEPGDELVVSVTARDNVIVDRIVAAASGAFTAAETLSVFAEGGTFPLTFQVPLTAPIGSVASFAVHAIDVGGLASSVRTATSPTLGDFTAPVVSGAEPNATIYAPLVPGDTFRVTVFASDNNKMGWVGYRLGQPVFFQDSVAVTGAAGNYPMTSVITGSWVGTPLLQPFAWDSSGNLGTPDLRYQLRILDAVRRPTRYDPSGVTVLDVAYDPNRDALYVLGGPGLGVITLATLQYAALPNPSYSGISIDVTPSGDTLLMPIGYTLGILDLTQSPPTVDTVPLAYDTALGGANRIAVTASNKALISLATGFVTAGFVTYDLTTGQTQTRTDVGNSGLITLFGGFIPSLDRSRVALLWGPGGDSGRVYQVANDAFTAAHGLNVPNPWQGDATADSAGNRFLLGGALHGPDLAPLATFDYPSNPDYPGTLVVSAITPDGQYAYFNQELGYPLIAIISKVRLADGVVVERILPPASARQMFVTPDGTTLVGIANQDGVFVIDLR